MAALLLGGCVSAFTRGEGDWTPADGPPSCNPSVGVAVDVAILAAGIYMASNIERPGLGCASSPVVCMAMLAGPPLALTGGGTIGVLGGGYKIYTCNKAKAGWRRARAAGVTEAVTDADAKADVQLDVDALRRIAARTDAEIDVYGDTLILHATSVERCVSFAWFDEVRRYRTKLVERGITHVSCRVAGEPVWDGTLE